MCKGCTQDSLAGSVQDLRKGQLCLDHNHNTGVNPKTWPVLADLIFLCKQGAPSSDNYISLCPYSRDKLWEFWSSLLIILWKENPLQTALPCPEAAQNFCSAKQDPTEFRKEQASMISPWSLGRSKLYCIELYFSNYCSRWTTNQNCLRDYSLYVAEKYDPR